MKRLITSLISLLVCTLAALAQTPQEIVSRMEAELAKHDDSEGVVMTVDVKIPILGTMSTKFYTLGEKALMEAVTMGVTAITWTDGVTSWTYLDKTNTIQIENFKKTDSGTEGDMDMFDGIADGYDVSLKKEDAAAWYIQCRKNKANPDKDAPKNMEIAVRKKDYFPVSLTASISGIKMTMKDISFGVSEKQVTFNIDDYPGAKVEDKR